MFGEIFNVRVEEGYRDDISYTGRRRRRKTVLLKFGRHSISRRAFQLGILLALCQVSDGLLTYFGVTLMGVGMEGNQFLQQLMKAYGTFPVLFAVKVAALTCGLILMGFSHQRRWMRPVIIILCVVYLSLAVVPWTVIISHYHIVQ